MISGEKLPTDKRDRSTDRLVALSAVSRRRGGTRGQASVDAASMRTLLRVTIVGLVWVVAVTVAVLAVDHGQAQARDDLVARFDGRAHTSAAFVSAYVADVFASERELAATLPPGGGSPAAFDEDVRLSGFTAAVLLDRTGRVVASSPAGMALSGVDRAAQYPHLASALAGEPTVTGVVLSAVKATPIAAFAIPIDGGEEGVLSVEYSFEESPLATFLAVNPIPGSHGYIIDADGLPGVFAGDGATADVDGFDASQELDGPVVVDGRVGVAAPIAGTPWRLMLTAPLDDVVAPATESDWVEWSVLIAGALGTLVGLVVIGSVGRSRRRSRQAQAESEQRFRLTVDNAPIGMSLVALDGQFLQPNAQLCKMLGYRAEELAARTFRDVTHSEDVNANDILNAKLISGELGHYEMEKRYIRRDGGSVWTRLSVSLVRDSEGRPLHYVSQVEDVTEIRAAQAQLEQRALYDPLTGLANRGLLIDRLTHALAEHRRDPGSVAVAYCDLDHFKRVNDSLGHHAGDALLQEVASRLQSVVRGGDTVARMGGDEFVLILPQTSSLEMVEDILERAKNAVEQPIEIDGHSLVVSFSAGLALGGSDTSAETLLRDADVALYAAKEGGRSRAEVFTAVMRSRAVEYQAVEEELRQAIELDQFELHYQPIVTLWRPAHGSRSRRCCAGATPSAGCSCPRPSSTWPSSRT